MKSGKAAGCDGIYPEFLIHSGIKVRNWLAKFYSDLLKRNRVPAFFKKSKIIAILKPGKPDDQASSYRPVALLSVGLKLDEILIRNRIEPLVTRKIPVEQAGFTKGRSCCDQVQSLTNFIEQGFQRRLKTGVVFIDLTAAYDTIWRRGLVYKLMKVIACRSVCDFIMTMLSDRRIQVNLNGETSRWYKLQNGLPQGSTLSCILYNLYVHDLPKSKARKFLYADDKAYAFQAKKFEKRSTTLTDELRPYSEFCRHWRVQPSISKTVVSSFQ